MSSRLQSSFTLGGSVRITEVSPRDGLQNIPYPIPTATKLELIARLARTGLRTIEITSVVSRRAVPQLADCKDVMGSDLIAELGRGYGEGEYEIEVMSDDGDDESNSGIESDSGGSSLSLVSNWTSTSTSTSSSNPGSNLNQPLQPISLPILVPNLKGLDVALSSSPNISSISVFTSATSAFSHSNTNCSVAESLSRARDVCLKAKESGVVWVRGYISCIFRDPITQTPTTHSSVLYCTRYLLDSGIDEVALSDTDGSGTPSQVTSLLLYLQSQGIPMSQLAAHFHDTFSRGLENVWAAYLAGIRVFDGSVAGLGGCPFAPGARGNVDTVALVKMFEGRGVRTGVDGDQLEGVSRWVRGVLRGIKDESEQEKEKEKGKEQDEGKGKRDSGFWECDPIKKDRRRSGNSWSALP